MASDDLSEVEGKIVDVMPAGVFMVETEKESVGALRTEVMPYCPKSFVRMVAGHPPRVRFRAIDVQLQPRWIVQFKNRKRQPLRQRDPYSRSVGFDLRRD